MEPENNQLVQTSNNIGIVKINKETNQIEVTCMYRSSLEADLDYVGQTIGTIFKVINGTTEITNRFSPWEPINTKLLNTAKSVYKQLFGVEIKTEVIHAGLECSLFYERLKPNIEIISFGPTMGKVHTTEEWLNVESVEKYWS